MNMSRAESHVTEKESTMELAQSDMGISLGFFLSVLGLIGAIVTFIISFKKQSGSLGKKGLFATSMLGVYFILVYGLIHFNISWKLFLIPILGFSVLCILDALKKDSD